MHTLCLQTWHGILFRCEVSGGAGAEYPVVGAGVWHMDDASKVLGTLAPIVTCRALEPDETCVSFLCCPLGFPQLCFVLTLA